MWLISLELIAAKSYNNTEDNGVHGLPVPLFFKELLPQKTNQF